MSNIVSIKQNSAKRTKRTRRRLVIVVIIVAVLAVAGVVAWRIIGSNDQPDAPSSDTAVKPQPIIVASAEEIQAQIDAEGDSKKKAELYGSMNNTHQLNGDYAKALEAALHAYELDQTASNSATVASLYEATGDKAKAVEYYKIALAKTPEPKSPDERSEYPFYQSKIKELEG